MIRWLLLLLSCCSCLLNSCLLNLHTRIADYGREYEGIILPRGKELTTWNSGDKWYVEGNKTLFERRDTELYYVFYEYPSGQLLQINDEPSQPCYVVFHRVQRRSMPLEDCWIHTNMKTGSPVMISLVGDEYSSFTEAYPGLETYPMKDYPWGGKSVHVSFADALPHDATAARPLGITTTSDRLTLEGITPEGVVYTTGERRLTWNSLWAYPLSGLVYVAVDIPCTLASALFVPFIEIAGNLGIPWFN